MGVSRMDGPDDSAARTTPNPTWEDIEAAIRRLDGNTCTLLCLGIGKPPVPHMGIGGVEDGCYVVYCTLDKRTFHKLIDAQAPVGKRVLTAGGQRGDYNLR